MYHNVKVIMFLLVALYAQSVCICVVPTLGSKPELQEFDLSGQGWLFVTVGGRICLDYHAQNEVYLAVSLALVLFMVEY